MGCHVPKFLVFTYLATTSTLHHPLPFRSMQQARSSLLAAHSGSQFLATQAALLQGIHTYKQFLKSTGSPNSQWFF